MVKAKRDAQLHARVGTSEKLLILEACKLAGVNWAAKARELLLTWARSVLKEHQ